MTAFPKYPAYKDSGVEWLGEVPEHWQTVRAKHLFSNLTEKGYPEEPLLSATQDQGVVPRDSREQRVVMPLGQLETFKLVKKHDFVISLRSFQGGIEHSNYRGLVSPAYTVLRQKRALNPGYLRHLLKASSFISELNVSVTGIRQGKNIDFGAFAESFLPIPPHAEQDRIVAFLDEKTAQIDALIAKKQRQIELLDEQKAILINHAVTRGLHPNPDLQDSGIPWIGPIPKHWQLRKLGAVVSFVSGATPSKDRSDFWNGGVPWISPKDMKRLRIDSSEDTISPAALKHTNIKLLPPETVLIVVRGMILARTVPIGLNTVPATINQDIKGMEVNQMVMSPEFLVTLLTACQEMLTPLIEESGHGTRCLRTESLKTMMLPTPPRDEQDELIVRVQTINDAAAKVQTNLESQIQTLQTLRSTLIAHAVTGKIKV